jgi:septal ring factor EnvC (AmiA/AmiB activator)
LDYLLARAKDQSTASNRLDRQIQDTQKDLADINKKKFRLLKESNKLTEVRPDQICW